MASTQRPPLLPAALLLVFVVAACGAASVTVTAPDAPDPRSSTASPSASNSTSVTSVTVAPITTSLGERVSAAESGGYTFAVVGDFYDDDPDDGAFVADALATRDAIIDSGAAFVLGLGDFDYVDADVDGFLEMIAPLEAVAPLFPAFGNHDGIVSGEVRAPAKYEKLLTHFAVDEFYAFGVGPICFISINSEYPEGTARFEEQRVFVEAAMAAAYADPAVRWIVPFFHRAMVNPPSPAGPDATLATVFFPLLDRYQDKIPIAFQAHHHIYVRTHSLRYDPDGQPLDCTEERDPAMCLRVPLIGDDGGRRPSTYSGSAGIVFATVGTGGAYATELTPAADYVVVRHAPVSMTSDGTDVNTFGYLAVTLDDDLETLTAEFRANNGEIIDRFIITG